MLMRRLLTFATLFLLLTPALAQAPAQAELTKLLNDFLTAASHTPASAADKAMFDRFFADDVIYTRSAGVVIHKSDIMKSFDEPPPKDARQGTYSAEDITINQFGNTAIVAFRLVNKQGDETTSYRNTGTFLRRHGKWQVVAWQATKIPPEEPQKK
jgi:uncharacterized protein DUF4440